MAGRTSAPMETEWQFDAIDARPVERWLAGLPDGGSPNVAPGTASTIVDTYLDTEDWRLHRAGYSLRVRRTRGRTEATLKSLDRGQDGFRRRAEFTEAVPGPDPAVILSAPGPVGTRAKLAAGTVPLVALFDVRTRRHVYRLTIDGTDGGEVAINRTTIPLGERRESARLRRVEVEVPESIVADVAPFVESLRSACALQPASLSKFEVGLLARGLRPAATPDLGPAEVDPSRSTGEAAFAILRRHFVALLAKEPGTRIGDDIEDLHDMRVATRRLRAALSIFSDVLPVRFARVREELGWVGDALGAVRDLDVQLEQLEAWVADAAEEDAGPLGGLRSLLENQRVEARVGMLGVLDSGRYARMVAGFEAALRRGPLRKSTASRRPVLGVAPDCILDRYRKLRKAGRRVASSPSPDTYHRVRISAKGLRYALEFLSPLYPREIPPAVKRLVELQDLLGLHQDADVAVRRLRSLVSDQGSSLAPQTIFAMGAVARRYEEQGGYFRARFPKAYGRLSGKRWKGLRREMGRRRPATPAAPVLRPVEPEAVPPEGPAQEPSPSPGPWAGPKDVG